MVQLNLALREINCKIVYFGPGLSGKTTNLEQVFEKAPDENRGALTSIATESDRTLFFDFMPLNLGKVNGMSTKFQLYTVPGQVYYNSTRKLVLRGADGVVFVADSSPDKADENIESLDNLEECLQEQGRSLADMPHAIQFNKRDLPGAMPVEDMQRQLNRHDAPCFEGVAAKGEGVVETFKALSGLVLDKVKLMAEDRPGGARPGGGASAPRGGRPARSASSSPASEAPVADGPASSGGGGEAPSVGQAPAAQAGGVAPAGAAQPSPSAESVAVAEPPPAAQVAPSVRQAGQKTQSGPAQNRKGQLVGSTRKVANPKVQAASAPKSKKMLIIVGVAIAAVAGAIAAVL